MSNIIYNPLIKSLIDHATIRHYKKGQTVVYPNDSADYVYMIKEGAVTLETVTDEGERKILYIFNKTTLFPMMTFIEKRVSSPWFYTTLCDTDLFVIPYADLRETLKTAESYSVYNLLIQQILTEHHELLLHVSNHVKTDKRQKLISILLFLLEHHTKKSAGNWNIVQFPVHHQLLSQMTGISREKITLTLQELTAMKLVRYLKRGQLELNSAQFSKQSHT